MLKRHLLLSAVAVCFIQTGAVFYAHAEVTPAKGSDLLFSTTNDVERVELQTNTTSQPPEKIDGVIPVSDNAPVDLLADRVEYDENAGLVSAIGNVELVQSGRILRAEKITYHMTQDKVTATGDVVLNEVTGEIYFADNVELKDEMKNGFVTGLSGVLADGGRFSAEEAEKVAELKIIMRKASYTACEPCKADPSKPPLWQIKAREVTHLKEEKRVVYDDATFEFAGVPVAYSPYFSHSDGSIKRKSGFLLPSVGFDSDLGAIYDQSYYWDIAPNKDATVGVMAMTDVNPLVKGEYRHRFENAEIELKGGLTYSDRIDVDGESEFREDNQSRGHLFADALWNINDKWRAGTALEIVSDSQYLRQYNFSNEDVLENKAYVERFDERNYTTAKLIRFKDIRVSDRKVDQPSVLPEIYSRFLGNPNAVLGGRWSFETSALGLHRQGSDQDMGRGSAKLGWGKRYITGFGLVNTLNLMARGDAYRVLDRDISTFENQRSDKSSAFRGFANANLQTSYPFSREFEKLTAVIEPLAAITAGTNLKDTDDIPNEDSQDVFLDATNIFNPNRFPGYDRIEDESHATYGLRTGLYGHKGYQGEVFVGQSYRLDQDNNPFPEGSGLSEQESDLVGNIDIRAGNKLRLNYSLQLDNDSLSSQRHEVDASTQIGRVTLGARYFYANALQGTDLDTSREQIRNTAEFRLTENWSIIGATQYDLARETEGLRRVTYGLDYDGQCVTFLITGDRRLTKDSSGDSGTQIMMRIGFKNLGEFETSGFTVGANE